jgi:hypothetical protein
MLEIFFILYLPGKNNFSLGNDIEHHPKLEKGSRQFGNKTKKQQ